MRKILEFLISNTLRLAFWLRYRVTVKGLDKLTPEYLKKPGGVLFLPNHPAAVVDPSLVTLAVFPKFPIRPMIVEYMYFLPVVHSLMKFLNALPVPDFESSSNSLKRKRGEMVINEVIKGLENGENFMIYPAGKLKQTSKEVVGGASATHRIVQEAKDANVVLVRTKGLFGSSFSRAFTGKTPPVFPMLINGIKVAFKNLIFFTPKREVTIEFYPAPADFPFGANRLELNRWLENWYNQPDGFTKQEGELPGDSLVLVSYSFWKNEVPELYKPKETKEEVIHIADISDDVQNKVYAKLQEMTELKLEEIKPEMSLSSDLGMDSLDISELAAFLNDQFNVGAIPVTELTTVNRVMGVASRKINVEQKTEDVQNDLTAWEFKGKRKRADIAPGETIIESFLNSCERMGDVAAYADARSGVVSYPRLKLGVVLFAEYIRKLPGKYIGIMLPASVGAYTAVLACQLAGKVPLMINWTVGPRHLQAVREISKVEVVLSSWAFLEKLDVADLTGVDDIIVMLETVKREFTLRDKLRAYFRSKKGTTALLKTFEADKLKSDDPSVLLFTSGTESMPKGVILSHGNILANAHGMLQVIDIYSDDVMLGVLPPFHAYGFTVSGLMGVLAGIRFAFYPNPTDGKGVAQAFQNWKATIFCGAPSFIKGMLKAATSEQLKTMRICVTGAEKAPPELHQLLDKVGKERCLIEGYGVTEASPVLSANIPGQPRKGVGKPLPGVELLIVHPDTHEAITVGNEGLILARGPNVFKGYLNPGLASPFINVKGKEWYNTGDIGFLDENNCLTISGRKKRFIKVGGEMVSLPALESALLQIAPKKGWTTKEDGPILAMLGKERPGEKPVIVLVTTFEASADEINAALRDSGFTNLIRISDIIKLEEIPLMGIGKIDYRLLEEKYLNGK